MSLDTSISPEEQVSSENTGTTPNSTDTPEPASNANNADGAPEAGDAPASESTENKPKRGRPKGSSARKTRTVELTLTVTGTADGEWQAELKHGSKWVARGLDIPAAAVSRAAKELHAELSGPIDEVINAAREQQQAKVAELEAELERAKQALAELES